MISLYLILLIGVVKISKKFLFRIHRRAAYYFIDKEKTKVKQKFLCNASLAGHRHAFKTLLTTYYTNKITAKIPKRPLN